MWRSIASNALTLFIVLFLLVAGLIAWGQRTYVAPGPLAQTICFKVGKGATMSAVSAALRLQSSNCDASSLSCSYLRRIVDMRFAAPPAPGAGAK